MTAQFVEAEGRERAEQRKPGGEREQQRDYGIAKRRTREQKAEDRIDHAEDDGVAWHRLEILPAELQGAMQIGKADGADFGRRLSGLLR